MVNLFRGEVEDKNSDLAFDDYSVKELYTSANAGHTRSSSPRRFKRLQ